MTLDEERNPGQTLSHRGRGFAAMDPTRQRDIAREGGRAAHEKGTAHEFTSEEARAAGLKSRMNRLAREANRQG
ncbi:KGG domain-containing protein [Variovorax sp. YR216]|uniref:KGG domain-containing protein n=1 Tax=Variovorax sp. YR216 TaxID=1882828 RepID=UPI00089C9B18|nr:Stress-induced acidophilic repeat motif-containing protein [Variovorax sp. YR216]